MIYIVAFLMTVVYLALGSHWRLWGGEAYYIPLFVLFAGAADDWHGGVVWLSSLVLTFYFAPISWTVLIVLGVVSILTRFLFTRWLDPSHRLVTQSGLGFMIGLFIVGIHWQTFIQTPEVLTGSLIITAPAVLLWPLFYRAQGRLT